MKISSTNADGETKVIHETAAKVKKEKKVVEKEEKVVEIVEPDSKLVEKEDNDDEERKKEEKLEKKRLKQQDKAIADALLKQELLREAKEEALAFAKKQAIDEKEVLKQSRKRKREERLEKNKKTAVNATVNASPPQAETRTKGKSLDNTPPEWFKAFMSNQQQEPSPPPQPRQPRAPPPTPKPFEQPPQPVGNPEGQVRRPSVVSAAPPSIFAQMFPGR